MCVWTWAWFDLEEGGHTDGLENGSENIFCMDIRGHDTHEGKAAIKIDNR